MVRICIAIAVCLLLVPQPSQGQTTKSSERYKLFKAIDDGKLDVVKVILEASPALIHVRDIDHGSMPLHHATTVEIARYLIEKGAELEALDAAHQGTPLRWAAGERHDEVAMYLRSLGARVDDIFLAIALGDIERVRAYLDADPKALEEPGLKCDLLGDGEHTKDPKEKGTARPLIVAINAKQKVMVKLLLDRGADPTIRGSYAFATPLHHAAFGGNPDILAMLLATEQCDLEAMEDTHHGTPLQWAVVSGKIPTVQLLLNAGAKVTPYIEQCAKDGEKGRLVGITTEKPDTFRTIQKLLKEHP